MYRTSYTEKAALSDQCSGPYWHIESIWYRTEAAGDLRRRDRYLENRAGERDPSCAVRRARHGICTDGERRPDRCRSGNVSELTALLSIKPSGAKRRGAFLELLHGSLGNQDVDLVGTVHDMRFVFLDNDTKLLCRQIGRRRQGT
jgi:hypothetical protein